MEILPPYDLFLRVALVVVVFGYTIETAEECGEGFTSLSDVEGDVTNDVVPVDNRLIVFPNINFTCETRIVKWTFAAQIPNGMIFNTRAPPEMQIWRASDGLYKLQFSTGNGSGLNITVKNATQTLIDYIMSEGVTVQAGDVFGMRLPGGGNVARFVPLFLDVGAGNAPCYLYAFGDASSQSLFIDTLMQEYQYVPLVAVEYETLASPFSTSHIMFMPSSSVDLTSTQIENLPSSIQSSSPSVLSFSTSVKSPTESISDFSMSSSMFSSALSIPSVVITSQSTIEVIMASTQLSSSSLINEAVTTSFPLVTTLVLPSSSLASLPTPTSSLGTETLGSFSVAAVVGIVIGGMFLVAIVILLVVLAILRFSGQRRVKADFDTSDVIANRNISPNTVDNPNYTGFVAGIGDPIPAYTDPISPTLSNDLNNSLMSSALYDSVAGNTATGIYHDPAQINEQPKFPRAASENHYEMGSEGHYEMEQPYSEPKIFHGRQDISSVGSASPYEEPINSSSSTMTTNHYEINSQLSSSRNTPATEHKYSIIHKEICVPSQAERNEVTSTLEEDENPAAMFDDRQYAELSKIQQQHQAYKASFFSEEANYWRPAAQPDVLYDQLAKRRYREIPRNQIQIIRYLGSGMFGNVYEGIWEPPSNPMGVAVKMLGPKVGMSGKVKLLQEAAIMGQFIHPNVVRLKGVVTIGEPIMIVLELMSKGDLRNHLRLIRPRPSRPATPSLPFELLEFCQQVAQGMKYLSSKAFVHRDLAARNILLDENYVCKIGDFGMSRDLEDENFYISHGGKIPVKWTAPEAFQFKKYSTASDVWSFGALMYEIWSLGHKPFEGFSNTKAIELVEGGYRLPPPPGCPRAVYELMIQCWNPDSEKRPDFPSVLSSLYQDPKVLLNWTDADKETHPRAHSLGALLEAGQDLYLELQQSYSRGTLRI